MTLLSLIDDLSSVFDTFKSIVTALPVEFVLLGIAIFSTFLLIFGFRLFKDW